MPVLHLFVVVFSSLWDCFVSLCSCFYVSSHFVSLQKLLTLVYVFFELVSKRQKLKCTWDCHRNLDPSKLLGDEHRQI